MPETTAPPSPPVLGWLGKLSHDLRNQLSPMRTATQLLLSHRVEPDRQREMLELVDRQVTRIARMLDDLSEYGRVHEEARQPRRERLDLGILVDTALGECGRHIVAAGLAFEQHMPERRMPLDGERQRLVQTLSRLLENAIRFTPPGGRIELSVSAEGGVAEVRVRDSGAGIPADRIDHIFDLPDAPRASERLGISLLLARACAIDHGGSLQAHSRGPGEGSEFVLRLPLLAT